MGRKNQPLTLELLVKEGNEALSLENDENSLNRSTEPPMESTDCLSKKGATKRGRPKIRKAESFKETLKRLLSMEISPNTVAEAVKSTPLGDRITYQEAILIAIILKASNGDIQAANIVREASGNKQKEGEPDRVVRPFESF